MVNGWCEVDKGPRPPVAAPTLLSLRRCYQLSALISKLFGKPMMDSLALLPETQDQVIRRSSCACIRPGCVGRTRTLKP